MQNFNNNIATYLKGDVVAAAILEKIRAWVDYNAQNDRNFVNGHFWTYNTIEEWCKQLVFCNPKVFYRKICKLKKLGLIYTEKFGRKHGNHTLWYTVNSDLYNKIATDCNNSYTIHSQSQLKPITKTPDNLPHASKEKTDIDFPNQGKSYSITNINKNKKGLPKKRGWYQPPEHQDLDTWQPPEELQNKIKDEYGLNDEQIKDAHNEFTLYNKAKNTKFKCLKYIFLLWCKRYKRFKARIKGIATRAAKVAIESAETIERNVKMCIEAIKNKDTKDIYYSLLKHLGISKFNKIGILHMRIDERSLKEYSDTIEFISWGSFWGDEVYALRKHRDEILEGIRASGYSFKHMLVCGA